MYQVDAFTTRVFHGNPAAVVLLDDEWLDADTLQAIAAENNLSETAFILRKPAKTIPLRWFTPTTEVNLCGHATLATAHVLWNHEGVKGDRLVFQTLSGNLPVTKKPADGRGGLIELDFLAWVARKIKVSPALCEALGRAPSEVYQSRDLLAVFDNKRDVHALKPDWEKLAAINAYAVIATAPGAGHDFVSRFFAVRQGVPEDPVTGSAHCTLIPYWASRLGKTKLSAHQVSKRGGELTCELRGDRVGIAGHAVTFSRGTITI